MSSPADPFQGHWILDPAQSTLSTDIPASWTQEIDIQGDDVSLREVVRRPDGEETVHCVQARFDGADYAVEGSPLLHTIAYTRVAPHIIAGTGKRDGSTILAESAVVDEETGTMWLQYEVRFDDHVVASGRAAFVRKLQGPAP